MKLLKLSIIPDSDLLDINPPGQEQFLSDQIELANSFFTRLRGLLGRESLPEGCGLLLSPCASIHCSGMKFPIDAIFLNGEFQVLRVAEHLAPGERAAQKKAKHVLELPAGQALKWGLKQGQKISFN